MFRKNIRLKFYNYKANGYYFVTICTYYRKPYLNNEKIKEIVVAELALLEKRFLGLKIDYYILMPDHIHLIFVLENSDFKLPKIIQAFKSITTLKAKQVLPLQINKRFWQPNYYEHVIRNEKALYKIREYIKYNVEKDNIDLSKVDKLY